MSSVFARIKANLSISAIFVYLILLYFVLPKVHMENVLGYSTALDKVEAPSNLESVLLDQKMRVEKHKMNFESLKTQHIMLQEAHAKLQVDSDVLNEELQRMEKRSEEIISTLQKERDDKIAECEQLRSQVLTPEKMEEVRGDLVRELEGPYRKYLGELESELDSFKSDYNKLKYNYSFLKSEYDSHVAQHRTELEELMVKHSAELAQLVDEKKELMVRSQRDIPAEVKRMRQLQRENSEYQQKVNMLTFELEELQEKLLSSENEAKKTTGTLQKSLEEMKVEKKVLEDEKLSLEEQLHRLNKEIEHAHDGTSQARRECAEKDASISQLNRKIDSMSREHKAQLSDLQMNLAQVRKQCNQEKDQLLNKLSTAERELEMLKKSFHEQQERLIAKSQEVDECVMRAKEEEWSKISSLEHDLSDAREKADQLEMESRQLLLTHKQEVEMLVRTAAVTDEKVRGLESSVSALRRECSEKEQKLAGLKKVQKENTSLTSQVSRLEESDRNHQDEKERMQNSVQMLSQELNAVKKELTQVRAQQTQEVEQMRRSTAEERASLQQELERCGRELNAVQDKYRHSQGEAKKKVKDYRRRLQSLQQEVERTRAEVERSKLEKDHVEKAVKLENRKLQGKFKSLHHHHQQLLMMLNQAPGSGVSTPLVNFTKEPHTQLHVLDSLSERLPVGTLAPHLQDYTATDTVSTGSNVD